jgi:hypothetical protein
VYTDVGSSFEQVSYTRKINVNCYVDYKQLTFLQVLIHFSLGQIKWKFQMLEAFLTLK